MDRELQRAPLAGHRPEHADRQGDDPALPESDPEAGADVAEAPPHPPGAGTRQEVGSEQADFRDRFDEDLFNDREDHPAQGNTADVAMGDQRFGSDADAYTEYAWRRAGDHHRGEESAVGQARDPADVADDDAAP